MRFLCINMDASGFSSDVLELLYGLISQEANRRQKDKIDLSSLQGLFEKDIDFDLIRNSFNKWLLVCKMAVSEGYPYKAVLLEFARKIEDEIATLASVKTQFDIFVKFSILRNDETLHGTLFHQRDPVIFNRKNEATINDVFNRCID